MRVEAPQQVKPLSDQPDAGRSDAAPARPAAKTQASECVRVSTEPAAAEEPQRAVSVEIDARQRVYYRVVDQQTGETVREVPPEELRRVARSIDEMLEVRDGRGHALSIDS